MELACSATLSPAYNPMFFSALIEARKGDHRSERHPNSSIVFIVCGGVKISLEEIQEYKKIIEVSKYQSEHEECRVNGEVIQI